MGKEVQIPRWTEEGRGEFGWDAILALRLFIVWTHNGGGEKTLIQLFLTTHGKLAAKLPRI